jgi:hypothetical protein
VADDKSKSISRAVKGTELKVIHMCLGEVLKTKHPWGVWWYASAILPPSGTVQLSGGGLTPRANLNWDFAEGRESHRQMRNSLIENQAYYWMT